MVEPPLLACPVCYSVGVATREIDAIRCRSCGVLLASTNDVKSSDEGGNVTLDIDLGAKVREPYAPNRVSA